MTNLMKVARRFKHRAYVALPSLLAVSALFLSLESSESRAQPVDGTQTLIFLRHGEKPAGGLGQLNCQGLNRAIELSTLLPEKFGKADYVFAANPTRNVEEGELDNSYSYIRPLMTISPSAIKLGLPVNIDFAANDTSDLADELLHDRYHNAIIYTAWSHGYLPELINSLLFWTAGGTRGPELASAPQESGLIEDPARIVERFGGNRDLLNQVLQGSESALGDLLERLRQSLAENNPKEACYVLHTLKGAAGNLGGSAFALRCGELEQALRNGAALVQTLTPGELDELQQLLARTVASLQLELVTVGLEPSHAFQETLDLDGFHSALQEILPLLRQSNLQALNLTDALAQKRLPCPAQDFDEFVRHVRKMEFSAALDVLQRMLLNN